LEEGLFQQFVSLHASSPTPQQFELSLVNWLFLAHDRLCSHGASLFSHAPPPTAWRTVLSSYSQLALEPLLLLRLPEPLLHVPLVLRLVVFITLHALLASRAAAAEAMKAKRATLKEVWKGSQAGGSSSSSLSLPGQGKQGRSSWDVCLFVDEGVFGDLQELILCRMLISLWRRFSETRPAAASAANGPDSDCSAAFRSIICDALDSITSRSTGLVELLLHFGLDGCAAALLCSRPRSQEAFSRGLYRAVVSLPPSGLGMTAPVMQGVLGHCLLLLQHSSSHAACERLCHALPTFITRSRASGCLTPFHSPSVLDGINGTILSIFAIAVSRFPVCAAKFIDALVLSEGSASLLASGSGGGRGGGGRGRGRGAGEDHDIASLASHGAMQGQGQGHGDGELVGTRRLRSLLLSLPASAASAASSSSSSSSSYSFKAYLDGNGEDEYGPTGEERGPRSVLASHLFALTGLLGLKGGQEEGGGVGGRGRSSLPAPTLRLGLGAVL
jgi:hypothetical protein